MIRKIKWNKGSGVLFLGVLVSMMALVLMILVMEFSNIQFCNTLSQTRADLIADSSAIYAQSYDYNYNQRQAEIMAELLTAYNNSVSEKYDIETVLSFPEDDTLTLSCTTYVHTYYPQLMGKTIIYTQNESTVKSVDIYGDIFVVPESLSNYDSMTNANTESNVVEGSGEGIEVVR